MCMIKSHEHLANLYVANYFDPSVFISNSQEIAFGLWPNLDGRPTTAEPHSTNRASGMTLLWIALFPRGQPVRHKLDDKSTDVH